MPSISEFERDQPPVFTFCGCKESVQLAASAVSKWPDGDITYTFEALPQGVTLEEAKAAAEWALGPRTGWSSVCNIRPRYVESVRQARVVIGTRRIDGQGGVLADCWLPGPGIKQVDLQFDTGDNWDARVPAGILEVIEAEVSTMPAVLRNRYYDAANAEMEPAARQAARNAILYAVVLLHEFGHALGMGHAGQGSSNHMAPIYNPNQKTFGPWDTQQSQSRYGKATASPPVVPPNPVPSSPTGGIMGNIAALFKIAAQLQPIITWLVNNQAQFSTILEVFKKLAEAFAKPQASSMAMSMGLSRDTVKFVVQMLSESFTRMASETPQQWDDVAARLFSEAVSNEWLLDLFLKMVSGDVKITEQMLSQALTEVLQA